MPLNPINYPSKYFGCSVSGLKHLTGVKDERLLRAVNGNCVSVLNFIISKTSTEELE